MGELEDKDYTIIGGPDGGHEKLLWYQPQFTRGGIGEACTMFDGRDTKWLVGGASSRHWSEALHTTFRNPSSGSHSFMNFRWYMKTDTDGCFTHHLLHIPSGTYNPVGKKIGK